MTILKHIGNNWKTQTSREDILYQFGKTDDLKYNKYNKIKEEIKIEHKTNFREKTLHGQFKNTIDEIMDRKS